MVLKERSIALFLVALAQFAQAGTDLSTTERLQTIMDTVKHTFTNTKGENLTARLELPIDQKPSAYALFAHCFTCNKDLLAVRNISRALTQNGFGVFRFDFTGLGESEGDFANTNFSSNIEDLVEAANYMEQNLGAPQLIIGHSLGGAAVIFAAKQISSIQAVATIGAPFSPSHVKHLFRSSIEEINESGLAMLQIGGRAFTIKKQFIDDVDTKNMKETVGSLKKPLLILHSPQDTIVGIDNASELYIAARHPKSFISLDGADHLLSRRADSTYTGNVIANWGARYIDFEEGEQLSTNNQVVTKIGRENYVTAVKAGRHSFIADEPIRVGGKDLGPTPYDLLLAALGTCTAMTLRIYSDRKKWDLQEVTVHMDHKKDYAKDCEDCESGNTRIDHIQKYIEVKGDLDDKQKERLLQIADKCPVHKTLHNTVVVNTELR